jgi:hypothetical protein
LRYSCGHVSTKKNVRGIKDAAASMPPQLRSSRYIRYRDNIGYPRYGERYDIGDNQYSSNNLSYCPINRFLESVPTLNVITNKVFIHRGGKSAHFQSCLSSCNRFNVAPRSHFVLQPFQCRAPVPSFVVPGRGRVCVQGRDMGAMKPLLSRQCGL